MQPVEIFEIAGVANVALFCKIRNKKRKKEFRLKLGPKKKTRKEDEEKKERKKRREKRGEKKKKGKRRKEKEGGKKKKGKGDFTSFI